MDTVRSWQLRPKFGNSLSRLGELRSERAALQSLLNNKKARLEALNVLLAVKVPTVPVTALAEGSKEIKKQGEQNQATVRQAGTGEGPLDITRLLRQGA